MLPKEASEHDGEAGGHAVGLHASLHTGSLGEFCQVFYLNFLSFLPTISIGKGREGSLTSFTSILSTNYEQYWFACIPEHEEKHLKSFVFILPSCVTVYPKSCDNIIIKFPCIQQGKIQYVFICIKFRSKSSGTFIFVLWKLIQHPLFSHQGHRESNILQTFEMR